MTVKFKHSLDRAESTPRCGYMGQSYYELLTAIKTDQWKSPVIHTQHLHWLFFHSLWVLRCIPMPFC